MLTNECRSLLAATSKQMCKVMRADVTVLTAFEKDILDVLRKMEWPQLNTVVLKESPWCFALDDNSDYKWRVLASIQLDMLDSPELHVIVLVEPIQAFVSITDQYKVTALEHVLKSYGASLCGFGISEVDSDDLGAAIIEKLSSSGWLSLEHIALSGEQLGIKTMSALVSSKLKNLKDLDLNMYQLDSQVMQQFAKGDWSCLQQLALKRKQYLDARGVSWLKTTNLTSLQQLDFSDTPISPPMMRHIIWVPLPQLSTMRFNSCWIGTPTALELQKANWPSLTELDLSQNVMVADAIACLTLATLPSLEVLKLLRIDMDADGMQQLVQAPWPKLQELNVGHNKLDCKAMRFLLTSEWSSTQRLNLTRNQIDSSGIKVLINGSWPQLQKLALDQISLEHAGSAAALGSTQADLTKLQETRNRPTTVLRNNVSHNL